MPTPEHYEVARLLLGKATEDLSAAQLLNEAGNQPDHIVGFHLQQAVEKSLEAVLAVRAVEIPRTHDLSRLVEQVSESGGAKAPRGLDSLDWLTPWGVLFRYDTEPTALDRSAALTAAEAAVTWAKSETN